MVDRLLSEPTYFGLGTKRETTTGTGIAWGSAAPLLIRHTDPPVRQKRGLVITDKNEFTGKRGIREKTVLRWDLGFTRQGRLLPHIAILAMALMSGKDAEGDPNVSSAQCGATAAYRHDIPIDPVLADLFTVTGWQANPLTTDQVIAGICCRELKITCKDNDHVRFAMGMLGCGSLETGVDISEGSLPSGEAYLGWEDCDLLFGGTFDGADVSSGVSIKEQVASFDLTIKLGIEVEYQMGGSGLYADAIIVKDIKPEDKGVMSLILKPEDDTYLNYLPDGTSGVFEFVITGAEAATGYNFKNSWVFPKGLVVKADPNTDQNIMTADMEIQSAKDDSDDDYPEVYFHGINRVTEYLAAVS